jgi:2-oxo-4-hydroxy-4-carboxy-5-ureidoimidazoline decarboxylase
MDALSRLNDLPAAEARAELLRCCGSSSWVLAMLARRPFADAAALYDASDTVWRSLGPADWREAFAHHPRIGDKDVLRSRFAATPQWEQGEQAGVQGAAEELLTALAEGNQAYEERFGYIFIVCATGKSAAEMLVLLLARLGHSPQEELAIAAEEQAKITRLRLTKLLSP